MDPTDRLHEDFCEIVIANYSEDEYGLLASMIRTDGFRQLYKTKVGAAFAIFWRQAITPQEEVVWDGLATSLSQKFGLI